MVDADYIISVPLERFFVICMVLLGRRPFSYTNRVEKMGWRVVVAKKFA